MISFSIRGGGSTLTISSPSSDLLETPDLFLALPPGCPCLLFPRLLATLLVPPTTFLEDERFKFSSAFVGNFDSSYLPMKSLMDLFITSFDVFKLSCCFNFSSLIYAIFC